MKEAVPEANIMAKIDSVESTVNWLQQHKPELAFMDIQLSDDLSFSIFEKIEVDFPVVFTTAYDEYALQAFKVNSIDYLLKPVDYEDLERSIQKLKTLRGEANMVTTEVTKMVAQSLLNGKTTYKSRFLVKRNEQFQSISVNEITCFTSENKITFLYTKNGKKFGLEESLEELDKVLDPNQFFKINRKAIAHIDSIGEIHTYFNGKLLVKLPITGDNEFVVSREKASHFKAWLSS